MEVIDVQSKDILFVMGFSSDDIKRLKMILDRTEISYDEYDVEEKAMVDYLHKKLYPTVVWVCKQYMPNLLEEGQDDVSTT